MVSSSAHTDWLKDEVHFTQVLIKLLVHFVSLHTFADRDDVSVYSVYAMA